VLQIQSDSKDPRSPSDLNIESNAHALASYAAICQVFLTTISMQGRCRILNHADVSHCGCV
jgi:hypothetical protein